LLIKKIVSLIITDYVSKMPSKFSNAKVIHNTKFADTENVNKKLVNS